MEREVVQHARSADGSDSPGVSAAALQAWSANGNDSPGVLPRHGRVTWYRLLGYFLTGSIGKHPVKNS